MAAETKQATQAEAAVQSLETRSLLDRIVEDGRIGQTPEERTIGKVWLKDLVHDAMSGQLVVSKEIDETINRRIGELDALISSQLNEIMHSEPLQKLEGAWRGLHYFVQQT